MVFIHLFCGDNCGVVACVRRGRHFDDFERIAVLFHTLFRLEVRVAAEHNIRSASRHIRRDSDRIESARLCDYLGFLLVEFCVQNVVRYALALQNIAELFALFNAYRTDEKGLTRRVMVDDVLHDCGDFSADFGVNLVVFVNSLRGFVWRNGDDVERVYALEFVFFGLCRTRHTREFFVHTEEVLEGYRRKRFVLASDLNVFLCFYRLMQAFVVATTYHNTARKFIHNQHFAVADDIVGVALHNEVRLECGLNVVIKVGVFEVGEVCDAEESFRFLDTFIGEHYRLFFFLDGEIVALSALTRKIVRALVKFAGFSASARNDERRSRLVDENRVNLVDYCVIEFALHLIRLSHDHIVSQKVEAEFVIGAVGYVALISLSLFLYAHLRHNDADGKSQKFVEFAHPRRVTRCEVVVDRDDVNALARERVEVRRKRCHERLAFARTHFGDTSLMKRDTADKLNVKVAHTQHSLARFSHHRVCVGKNMVESFAVREPLFEHVRLTYERIVIHRRVLGRESLDFVGDFIEFSDLKFVFVKKCHSSPLLYLSKLYYINLHISIIYIIRLGF